LGIELPHAVGIFGVLGNKGGRRRTYPTGRELFLEVGAFTRGRGKDASDKAEDTVPVGPVPGCPSWNKIRESP